ncbi:phytanoyl-CoA dioxygenase family protein [Humisphaera borealis]|uniref:Phytanoyl-CoA dioxygenase family protein n=2 Tax=Humisphaera borealis TaxID=2807512 RepID=A0A7M2X3M5_9BACT|nr:phytanoyl-CoA dioxygenase family protein [Humisphaera borealis]
MEMLDLEGYELVPRVIPPTAVASLCSAVSALVGAEGIRQRNDRVYAIRNLLSICREVRQFADSAEVRSLVESAIGGKALPVRAILFDKTPESNWKVPWHQDLSIAVRERMDVPGFGPWSVKAGVVHVQPPVRLLESMLTLRLHLDDCQASNGPLRVLPGSHRHGTLSPEQIEDWRSRVMPVSCVLPAGGAVLMRPLILHASSPATEPGHRRVVHIEWSSEDLPHGLQWHQG